VEGPLRTCTLDLFLSIWSSKSALGCVAVSSRCGEDIPVNDDARWRIELRKAYHCSQSATSCLLLLCPWYFLLLFIACVCLPMQEMWGKRSPPRPLHLAKLLPEGPAQALRPMGAAKPTATSACKALGLSNTNEVRVCDTCPLVHWCVCMCVCECARVRLVHKCVLSHPAHAKLCSLYFDGSFL